MIAHADHRPHYAGRLMTVLTMTALAMIVDLTMVGAATADLAAAITPAAVAVTASPGPNLLRPVVLQRWLQQRRPSFM